MPASTRYSPAQLWRRLVHHLRWPAARPHDQPRIFVCAFGKHPGATDHFEYIPRDSQDLPVIWDMLYEQGLKTLVGAWKQLPGQERLEEFNHLFTWQTPRSITVGRFWSSSDGASPPRRDFPMVVCAECHALPLSWALTRIPPYLATIEQQCRQTDSLDTVRTLIDTLQADLQQQALQDQVPPVPSLAESLHVEKPPVGALAALADCPELAPDRQGLLRLLYHLSRDLPILDSHAQTLFGKPRQPTGQQLRLPICGHPREHATLLWMTLMTDLLGPPTDNLVALAPLAEPWIDLLTGPLSPAHFACIRSSLRRIPLTTTIPYDLEEAFVTSCTRFLDTTHSQPNRS